MSTFKRKDPAQLQAQLQSMKNSGFEADLKEWKLTQDNAGNGSAVIRFLPAKNENSLPFVKLVNHFFKGQGKKFYAENCTSTHGDFDSCPVCQYIKEEGLYDNNKKMYDSLKRKTSFWSNILVIKDPAKPENEGKVFKYRFGVKIMDKINAMVEVDTDIGEVPVDVTCPFEGANFVIKVKKVGGHPNYDESKFQGQSKIKNIDDEAYQDELTKEMFDLDTIVSSDKFNSHSANEKLFKGVMGTALMSGAAVASTQADDLANELDNFDSQMDSYADDKAEEPKDDVKLSTHDNDSDDLDDLLDSI